MIELKIAEALQQHVAEIPGVGLMHGKMGISLFFFHLGKFTHNDTYTDYASELVESVLNSLNKNSPVDFEYGLAGVGWGFEYLLANGFVQAAAQSSRDEVLAEIDSALDMFFIWGNNSTETLLSIAYYFISRLGGREADETNGRVLNIKHKLILLLDDIERIILEEGASAQVADVLRAYRRLNLYNYKVEKLQKAIGRYPDTYFMPFIPKIAVENLAALADKEADAWIQSQLACDRTVPEQKWGLAAGLAGAGLQLLKAIRSTE